MSWIRRLGAVLFAGVCAFAVVYVFYCSLTGSLK